MLNRDPAIISIEQRRPDSNSVVQWCVTFRIDCGAWIELPIWLPQDTEESDLVAEARAKLHRFGLSLADRTKAWVP